MTLEACRRNFIELLADPDNRVVALSGKWGTGKTHLWGEIQKASSDDQVKKAVTISLFGVSSLNDLKMKVAQSVLPEPESAKALGEFAKKNWEPFKKILKQVFTRASIIDELELMLLPRMLRGRFIVIDDIERKHEKLSIDEILGFIDDCVQKLDCRILLILNSDQLKKDKDLWEIFREKVIDQEVRLETTPAEAFGFAEGRTKSAYSDQIKPCVEACGISNIRIIRKILRTTNRILSGTPDLPAYVLERVIPSLTLLCAIHYKGIDDGPSFDFVLGFNGMEFALSELGATDEQKDSSDGRARERWRLLMGKLRIRATDDFERLVAEYLKSGLFDASAVSHIVERYKGEEQQLTARKRVETFFEHCIWFPDLSEQQLLDEAAGLEPDAYLMDIHTISRLHTRTAEFPGGEELADRILDTWVAEFRARYEDDSLDIDEDLRRVNRAALHPKIEEAIRQIFHRQQKNITVLDCCRRVREKNSWGSRENNCMQAVTASEYERSIREASGEDLRLLLLQSMDFLRNAGAYNQHFGQATDSFLAACQSILRREPESRRSELIRTVFRDSRMSAVLYGEEGQSEGDEVEKPVQGGDG